ncbi:Methyl-accepting chemotaxis protein mcpC [Proteiniborus sp. DW1]|nr:Methyl-accepting chemotaxis protein mcpC [Proteiniborus sp. DW1]
MMKKKNRSRKVMKAIGDSRVNLGIRGKISIVFVLIITLSNMVLGLGAYFTSKAVVRDQFEDLTKTLGNEISRTIESYFHSFEEAIKFMATDSNVRSVNSNEESATWMVKSFENFINSYTDVTNVYLGTEKGDMYLYPKSELPSDYDPRKRDWYIETVNNKELTWVAPYIDTGTKELVITAGVPIYEAVNPNKLIGVLAIDVKLDTLSDIITSITIGKDSFPILYDKEGTVLIHKNKDLIGQPSTIPKLIEAIKSGDVSFLEYNSDENGIEKRKLATISVLDRLDWRIVSGINLEEISSHTSKLLFNTSLICFISIVVTIIFAFIFSRTLTRPIKSLSYNMEKVKEGDFTSRPNIKTRDEIGLLGESFNIMIDNLSNLINVIQNVSYEVSESAQHLADTAEETSISSEEVTRTVEEIAKGASEQAHDTETGVMLVTNLADRFVELANSSNEMFEVARDVMNTSINSVKIVDELHSKTELNNVATNEVENEILNLDEKIRFIGEILQTINSIAEQTNLLALNASIEAARAGEHGRGFAVVADEIRKLSYESRESSDKIKDIVETIQNDSKHTVDTMKIMKERTEEQTQAVKEVNNAFDKISSAVEKIAQKIEMIHNYVNDMNRDKDKIVESIESISAISEETAAASEEVTASMEQQSAAVNEVAEAALRLNELAMELNKEITRFKI